MSPGEEKRRSGEDGGGGSGGGVEERGDTLAGAGAVVASRLRRMPGAR